jgi:hypothetical protein
MGDEAGQELPRPRRTPIATAAWRWFDRWFWLGARVAGARATAYRPGQPGFDEYLLALELRDTRSRIGDADRATLPVLVLNCIAAELLVRAHLARAGHQPSSGPLSATDWDKARQLAPTEVARRGLAPDSSELLMALVGAERTATVTRLRRAEREQFAATVHDLVLQLADPLDREANRLGWALFARWSRLALASVTVALVIGLGAVGLHIRLSPANIALHRPVLASSTNDWAPDPNKLTDGITDVMGVHTNSGGQQWVVIDLGDVKKFQKLVVYNRPDCCSERAVPLRVEVSDDQKNYSVIAERQEPFDIWTVTGLHAKGRYIRLSNTPPNFLHLAEVEVY